MLTAPRTKPVRETEKVLFVNLIEDGNHGLLENFVFQSRDPQRTLPSIFFLYVHSPRWHRSVRPPVHPAVEFDQSTHQPAIILLHAYTIYTAFPIALHYQ